MTSKILVTGVNGFIAMHIVNLLLKQGHQVRGTIRNLNDTEKVQSIQKLGSVELFQADLLDAESWKKPVEGIDIVMHVASPLPVNQPTDENLLIKPAVEGTLNVLNAALNANVKRVVLTSSGLTVYGHDSKPKTYSEQDWVDINDAKTAYQKSKILAEKAAWNFVNERKNQNLPCFDLAVILPVFVLGPVLSASSGSSVTKFSRVFDENLSQVDNYYFATCDVRDVALAHVKAAFSDQAVGHRNLILSSTSLLSVKNWVEILKEEFGSRGYKIAEVNETNKNVSETKFEDSRMRNVLEITPTDFRSTIIDMTNSLIEFGILKRL